ncbi:MAG: cysteine hydrolase [Eubacteriaceae bacterium]|nr:cysteine hydrolase [Eubacteriaceae bacterium]
MKKALAVIDMQVDFVSGSLANPAGDAIVQNVAAKIDEYKKAGDDVIFTRDTHQANYLDTQEGKYLPVEHCIYGTPGWEIIPELDPAGCVIVDKPTFGSIELAEKLKAGGYGQVELAGLVSSICVVSNALILKAFLPEARLVVDASCTAGLAEEDYKASLDVMKTCQVDIINE